ncbi:hypothetical protein Bpfe_003477 [Biomphalaria pfeifferi]|uniref:Immunoglobulin subtype domain-containing protein n=1 Tax=Biomphalaria pfeifferi TaxID=112525 RepID=A0AAD8C6C1_BIOPF|nr:hypothetical protein Bpfe_003477 [Biomphalaria pfeifferi]
MNTAILPSHILLFTALLHEYTFACSRIETGKPFTFSATIVHTLKEDLEVVWFFGDETMSQCSMKMRCLEDFEEKTITTLKETHEQNKYECELRIINVTRGDAGLWVLKYMGAAGLRHNNPLYSCHLKVSDPPDVVVNNELTSTFLKIETSEKSTVSLIRSTQIKDMSTFSTKQVTQQMFLLTTLGMEMTVDANQTWTGSTFLIVIVIIGAVIVLLVVFLLVKLRTKMGMFRCMRPSVEGYDIEYHEYETIEEMVTHMRRSDVTYVNRQVIEDTMLINQESLHHCYITPR